MAQQATNYSTEPPKEGLRQLLTAAALRTLLRSPRHFFANLRQGPDYLRDRRRRQLDVDTVRKYVETEPVAVSAVLDVDPAAYERATRETWIPAADPNEPLSAWNARLELLRMMGAVTRLMRPQVVVETGVALGFTTATTLQAMADVGSGHVYSVDLPAIQYNPNDPVGRAIPEELKDRWTLELGDSRTRLGPLCARVAPIDIFLHDALHTYSAQLREYRTAWPHIRPGGLLISDDVNNPAFIEFAREVGARPHLIVGSTRADAVGILRRA